MTDSFKTALADAKTALQKTTEDRRAHLAAAADDDIKIVQLRRTIVGLSALCGEDPELESMGLTDAVRLVMKGAINSLTVRQVKDALGAHGFDQLSEARNAEASITVVLNRLAEAGEIRKGETRNGTKVVAMYTGPKVR